MSFKWFWVVCGNSSSRNAPPVFVELVVSLVFLFKIFVFFLYVYYLSSIKRHSYFTQMYCQVFTILSLSPFIPKPPPIYIYFLIWWRWVKICVCVCTLGDEVKWERGGQHPNLEHATQFIAIFHGIYWRKNPTTLVTLKIPLPS